MLLFYRVESTVDQALVITEEVDDLLETSESEIDVSRNSIQTIRAQERRRRRPLRSERFRQLHSAKPD